MSVKHDYLFVTVGDVLGIVALTQSYMQALNYCRHAAQLGAAYVEGLPAFDYLSTNLFERSMQIVDPRVFDHIGGISDDEAEEYSSGICTVDHKVGDVVLFVAGSEPCGINKTHHVRTEYITIRFGNRDVMWAMVPKHCTQQEESELWTYDDLDKYLAECAAKEVQGGG